MPMPLRHSANSEAWQALYSSGKSVWEIGKQYGVGGQTVWNYLKRADVPRRSGEDSIRKHPIRANAFDDVTDPAAMYWLGLLYANGGMVQSKKSGQFSVSLTCHEDDADLARGLAAFLGLPPEVRTRPDKRAVWVSVCSKTLCARLLDLGVTLRKSKTITLPTFLTAKTLRHFCRGYFDGDGSVGFRHRARYTTPQGAVRLSGNYEFIEQIVEAISQDAGVRCSGRSFGSTLSAGFEGRNQLMRLYDWFYGEGGPRGIRKHAIFRSGLELDREAA